MFIEKRIAAIFQFVQQQFKLRQTRLEIAQHIGAIHRQLAFDIFNRFDVVAQGFEAHIGGGAVGLRQPQAHAQRIEQLQAHSFFFVQRPQQIILDGGKTAGFPSLGVVGFAGFHRVASRNRKDCRFHAQQRCGVGADKLLDFGATFGIQNINFIDNQDDFLAPFADMFQKRALAFGERPIRRRDKQHQIRARHVFASQFLVTANDRVGAGRVHNVEFAQQWRRIGSQQQKIFQQLRVGLFTIAQNVDAVGRRRNPFGQNPLANQSVDEARFARIKLARDHDQE